MTSRGFEEDRRLKESHELVMSFSGLAAGLFRTQLAMKYI
jgi:hypothetical protein